MGMIRVLLAERDSQLRETIHGAPVGARTIEVVGTAADGNEALRLVQTSRPDVAVFMQDLPLLDGVTAAEHLRLLQPDIGVVVIALDEAETIRDRVLQSGAHHLIHGSTTTDLLAAVCRAAGLSDRKAM